MKTQSITTAFAVAFTCATLCLAQTPLGSEFTYQGLLKSSGASGVTNADLRFSLFNSETAGTQIGTTLSRDNVAIVNGVLTLTLDFGAAAFAGQARWLEIEVRSPAGVGGFTTLSPRQPITATPNATYSRQTRGIFVDAIGKVGLNTTSPGKLLTVAGDMELTNDFPQLRLEGGNSDGFLYSSPLTGEFPVVNDGIHLGYNFFRGSSGGSQFVNPNLASSCLSLGSGTITLATMVPGQTPVNRLTIDETGRVGIGSISQDHSLNVDGSVLMNGIDAFNLRIHEEVQVFGGEQGPSDEEHLIWKFGDRLFVPPGGDPGDFVKNPQLKMISPVTGDELAGFYRDHNSGNGVMFADDKNFRAPNPADASTDIWYCCPEGPEAAMYVRGTGRLVNGRATIELPDHFRSLASEPGMTVQLTPLTIDSRGLGVIKKSLSGIEVGEMGGGTGNFEFDWRVEAVRKGWENYKVIRPWLQSDENPDRAWQNRLKAIEERRAHGKPSPDTNASTPRPKQ